MKRNDLIMMGKAMHDVLKGFNDGMRGVKGTMHSDNAGSISKIAYDLGWQAAQPRNGEVIGPCLRRLIGELESKQR